jgi:hypothetical protein
VRRADIGCSKIDDLRMEMQVGKVSEDERESASKSEGRDVFKEEETGSKIAIRSRPPEDVADDLLDGRPDPSLVVDAAAFASGAPRLTREASSKEIHASTPASAVEGKQVVPDRRRIQPPFLHARNHAADDRSFPLDVTDGMTLVEAERELESELESAGAGAERESMQGFGRYSHAIVVGLLHAVASLPARMSFSISCRPSRSA